MSKNLFVIIPLFNEEGNILELTKDMKNLERDVSSEFNLNIIFVDDGSYDNTSKEVLSNMNGFDFKLLKHKYNMGPGVAFATAFESLALVIEKEDWVVTMEGDNTSRMDTLLHMLIRMKEGYDVVLASPYLYNGGIAEASFGRIMISHVANALVKILMGLRGIQTFSSFFRLYNGDIILKLQRLYGDKIIRSNGFECMIELLVKLVRLKATISEVEMRLDWSKRVGKSKMKIVKTIIGYLKLIYRIKFNESIHFFNCGKEKNTEK